MTDERQAALDAYWAANTPAEETAAMDHMVSLGMLGPNKPSEPAVKPHQTTDRREWGAFWTANREASRIVRLERENADLKRLIARLTDVAENLAGELRDPGPEALAAIYCGRKLICD